MRATLGHLSKARFVVDDGEAVIAMPERRFDHDPHGVGAGFPAPLHQKFWSGSPTMCTPMGVLPGVFAAVATTRM